MTTYYVRATDGNDTDTGLTVPLAFATIQKAFDTAVAGDLVLICNDATHAPTAQIDMDTNAGTGPKTMIVYRGCAADGTDDGTRATVDDSALVGSYLFKDGASASCNFIRLENLIIDGGSTGAILIDNTQMGVHFLNVDIKNSSGFGLKVAGGLAQIFFTNCEIFDNTTDGLTQQNDDGLVWLFNCAIHDNGGEGVNIGGQLGMLYCLSYNNAKNGLNAFGYSISAVVANCVFYNNLGDGICVGDIVTRSMLWGGNNIFHSNGLWGVNLNNYMVTGMRGPNVYYNNGTGAATTDTTTDEASVVDVVGTPVTTDPGFTSLVSGSENFLITTSGSAFQAGLPGTSPNGNTGFMSMGALIPDEPDVGISTGLLGKNFGMLPVNKSSEIV